MTAAEYVEALEALGLSRARLGRLLDLDKSTPSRWATGSVPVPMAVALLLRAMREDWVSIEELEQLND